MSDGAVRPWRYFSRRTPKPQRFHRAQRAILKALRRGKTALVECYFDGARWVQVC